MAWKSKKGRDPGCVELADGSLVCIFIEDVLTVCKKHGFSIGHEDGHGGFEIHQYREHYSEWLRDAKEVTDE